jgi:hypothetical protein
MNRGKVGFDRDFEAVKRWADKTHNHDRETMEIFASLASNVYTYLIKAVWVSLVDVASNGQLI